MSYTRESLISKILGIYASCYDIETFDGNGQDETGDPLRATAFFHEHQTGYMLLRKAEMWSADRHEYTYIFSMPVLTENLYRECTERAVQLGSKLIHPENGHMCSAITALFICDSADAEALRQLRSCKIRKSFQFSLKGWMEVHTAAAVIGEETAAANGAGRNDAKFLNSLFHPKKQNRLFKFLSK